MISDGKDSYMWMDGQTSGYKMKFDDSAKPAANTTQNSGVDPNKNMDYKCSNWSADGSLFTLPSNVQFQDMSAMMGGAGAGASANMMDDKGMKTIQMQACASLSEPQKSQCEAALKK
jgi:hypothetical protein